MSSYVVLLSFHQTSIADNNTANNELKVRGIVRALQSATLSSQLYGQVTYIPDYIGKKFSKGDILIKFDCSSLNQKIVSSRSEVKIKEQVVKSNETLKEFSSIGTFDLDKSVAELDKAKSDLQVLNIDKRNCSIKAPFSGYVVEKHVNRFEAVKQYEKLISIVNTSKLNIELIVPSDWLSWLRVGDEFDFYIEENKMHLKGDVLNIIPKIDAISKTIKIISKINLSQDQQGSVYPGMSGFAVFNKSTVNGS